MKKMKAILLGLSIFCMTTTVSYAKPMQLVYDGKVQQYELKPITLYINNNKIETPIIPPIQLENRTLVPAREVFEPLGAKVEWKNLEKKVYIDYKHTLLILEVNNKEAWIDGKTIELDVPAKIINNKIMLPVRFISEQMGFSVDWNEKNRSVNVSEEGTNEVTPTPKPTPTPTPIPTPTPKPTPKPTPTLPPTPITPTVSGYQGQNNLLIGEGNANIVNITPGNYSRTNIKTATVGNNMGATFAMIQASSPITYTNIMVDQGKVVVDITNSTSQLSSTIAPAYNDYIKNIRTSQFTPDTTRVVFDLKTGASISAKLSDDRKNIIINLMPQQIEAIATGIDSKGEYLALQNMGSEQLKITDDKASGIIRFEVKNAHIKEEINWNNFQGEYMQGVSVKNTANGIAGTIQVRPGVDYNYKTETTETAAYIRLTKPPFKNLSYTLDGRPSLMLTKVPGLSANRITVDDRYREKKIVIDLGGDYSQYFGDGTFSPSDNYIDKVTVATNGTTKLTVSEKNIYAVNVIEVDNKVQVQFVRPKDKYRNIVVLDPGHGGPLPGAIANNLVEKTLNLKHAMAVYEKLQSNPNIKVYMTRITDADVRNQSRADLANEVQADIFVSMHNNSVGKTDINGTELLYAAKNSDARAGLSNQMATIMLRNIQEGTNIGIRRTIPRTDLLVLNQTKMPAILIETGYMTSPKDASIINSPEFVSALSQSVYEGIVEIFDTMSFR